VEEWKNRGKGKMGEEGERKGTGGTGPLFSQIPGSTPVTGDGVGTCVYGDNPL